MTTPETASNDDPVATDAPVVDAAPLPVTAQEWQALLDERFPEGALVSSVLADGTLAPQNYACPVLMVLGMRETWPSIVGIAADGRDLQLFPATWTEIDRDGHYIVRVKQADLPEVTSGQFEISSWLSPEMAAALAPVRDSQREWLSQAADVPEPEVAEGGSLQQDLAEEQPPSSEPAAPVAPSET